MVAAPPAAGVCLLGPGYRAPNVALEQAVLSVLRVRVHVLAARGADDRTGCRR